MSSATSGISLLGGIPLKSQDFAASIIFAAVYFLFVPLVAWRLFAPATRSAILIRPAVFVLARCATFVIRAVQADGHNEDTGLYIGEQILLLCGFVLLCEPLMALAGFHITRHVPPTAERGGHAPRVMTFLRLCILAALVLGIYAGTKMGSVIGSTSDDSGTLDTLKTCRDVNAILCLVVTVSVGLTVAFWHLSGHNLPARATLLLLAVSLLLTVSSAYKLFIYEKDPAVSPTSGSTKAGFYCLSALPEALATALYLAVNVVELCDVRNGQAKNKESKAMRKAEKEGRSFSQEEGLTREDKYPPAYAGANQA